MENCVVTKYLGVVNDSTLEKFNSKVLRVYRNTAANQYVNFAITAGKYISNTKVGGSASFGPEGKRINGEAIAITGTANDYVDIEIYNYFNMQNFLDASLYAYDLSLLEYNNTVTTMNFLSNDARGHRIQGNIALLSKCTQLKALILQHCYDVYGALEDLAAGQVANGRTSGTLVVNLNRTQVTVNGRYVVASAPSRIITFDSTVPNGYTISLPA